MKDALAKADFIFELYTEEIPASYQKDAVRQVEKNLPLFLKENQIEYESYEIGASPRRMYVYVKQASLTQSVVEEKIKGPPKNICFDKENKPTKALEGFSQKANLPVEKITFEEMGKTEYATALVKKGGQKTEEVLPGIFEKLIKSLEFKKTMRWGDLDIEYARPIIQYFAMLDNKELSFSGSLWDVINRGEGICVSFATGMKFEKIKNPEDYFTLLRNNGVIVNHNERKEFIEKELIKTAEENSLKPVLSPELLDEVNFLVEKPQIVTAEFPKEYLELPDIVTLSEMQEHQKYFGMREKNGSLSSKFLIVSNQDVSEKETRQNIKTGNERVLKARLSDGSFFFQEDRKISLSERIEKLKKVLFQEGLGSLFEKQERLKEIAALLKNENAYFQKIEDKNIKRACDLLKTDLTTNLVYEFDHLQGEIGKIYAQYDKEDKSVCDAIFEHYLPRRQGDSMPDTDLGVLLSLSEKFDNIYGGFLLGKNPTASQDPFGLRRQALYAIEIIIKNELKFSFQKFIEGFSEIYPEKFQNKNKEVQKEIWIFFRARIGTIFEKEGFNKKLIAAGLESEGSDIYDLYCKLFALKDIQSDPEFGDLMTAFKRMNNIVEDALKAKNFSAEKTQLDVSAFVENEESSLYKYAEEFQKLIHPQMSISDYEKFFLSLAKSKKDVDEFFDNVMVMVDDEKIKQNRLALLSFVIKPVKSVLKLEALQ
ncbi:MAG: glycine--tRNA ligase subunit beta [Spirochaetia bacterium]|nr:glycine--tRNA ligase subunit beta [Spirochaetia bacterium]